MLLSQESGKSGNSNKLSEILKAVQSASGRNAESVLDAQVKRLRRLQNETDAPVIEDILFKAGCKYQFVDKEKAKQIFTDLIASSDDFVTKSICCYQLGFADWGEKHAAAHYELAINYMAEVEDPTPYASLLGNCYGNAGFLHSTFNQVDQAKRVYSEFFSHGNLPLKVRPDLTISYAASLLDLSPQLDVEQREELRDVVSKAMSRAVKTSDAKVVGKSCDAAMRMLAHAIKSETDFAKITTLVGQIKELIRKSGDDQRLLEFLVQWQLIAFFKSVEGPEFSSKVAKSVSESANEIASLLSEKPETGAYSVLENKGNEANENFRIRVQSNLMVEACKKLTSTNSSGEFKATRKLLDQLNDPNEILKPVVPDFGRARRWDRALQTATKLIQNGDFDQVKLETFQVTSTPNQKKAKSQTASPTPTLANPKGVRDDLPN